MNIQYHSSNYSTKKNISAETSNQKQISFGFRPNDLTRVVEANQHNLSKESSIILRSVAKFFETAHLKLNKMREFQRTTSEGTIPPIYEFNLQTRNLIPPRLQQIQSYRADLPQVDRFMAQSSIQPGKRNGEVVAGFAEKFRLERPHVIEI